MRRHSLGNQFVGKIPFDELENRVYQDVNMTL